MGGFFLLFAKDEKSEEEEEEGDSFIWLEILGMQSKIGIMEGGIPFIYIYFGFLSPIGVGLRSALRVCDVISFLSQYFF